jgi:quinol monooxygenase YgiN
LIETPNTFVLVEEWSDIDALYEDFGKMVEGLGDVLAGPPEVSIHQAASTQTLDEALAAAGVAAE